MRLLYRDDEGRGLRSALRQRALRLFAVLLVYAARNEVSDEKIGGQVVAVAPKLDDDVAVVGEVAQDFADDALAGGALVNEAEPLENAESAAERAERRGVLAQFLGEPG